MKWTSTQSLTALASAAGGAALVFFLVRTGKIANHETENSAQTKSHNEIQQTVHIMYHCPMHPQVIRDHAGNCPICGMTLVPMQSHNHENDSLQNAIHMEAGIVQSIGVRTAAVQESKLQRKIHLSGSIELDPQRIAVVNARTMGWIESIAVGAEGLAVAQGQTLATFYSPDLVAAEQDYLQALHTNDASLISSARNRLEVLNVSTAIIDSISKSHAALRTIPLQSPLAGIVLKKSVEQGQNVQAGADLYRIADLSHVWAVGKAYPEDLAKLRVGLTAQVSVQSVQGAARAGRIIFVAPTVDPETKIAEIRVDLKNTASLTYKPGMNADLELQVDLGTGIAVPAQAVIRTGERTLAIVALGGGNFAPRNLVLGEPLGDSIQVLQGLSAGDSIVTSAQFLIDGESNLKKAVEEFGK